MLNDMTETVAAQGVPISTTRGPIWSSGFRKEAVVPGENGVYYYVRLSLRCIIITTKRKRPTAHRRRRGPDRVLRWREKKSVYIYTERTRE